MEISPGYVAWIGVWRGSVSWGSSWKSVAVCIVLRLGFGSSLFLVLRFSGSLVLVYGYSISLDHVIYITYTIHTCLSYVVIASSKVLLEALHGYDP